MFNYLCLPPPSLSLSLFPPSPSLSSPMSLLLSLPPFCIIIQKYRAGGSSVCSYWDQSLDDNYGGWSSHGCTKISENANSVLCHCTHLTSFGLLVDTTPRNNYYSIGHHIIMLGPLTHLLLNFVVILSYLISR